jgi:hypothetical protein
MNPSEQRIKAAIECIKASLKLIAEGKVESAIRHSLSSYLRQIFPDNPGWLERHIEGSEAAAKFARGGSSHTGFVDNLVDLTVIEYESDLTIQRKFETGLGQVKDYCASLLNRGHDADLIVGVLSDTVRWGAYGVRVVRTQSPGLYGRDDIELEQLEPMIDLSSADKIAALKLISFLTRYLGRIGSRPLTAISIAKDLGFESNFCAKHIDGLRTVVRSAIVRRSEYSALIADLWGLFVNYVRNQSATAAFDEDEYADELYIVTLAKLVIANVITRRALLSNDAELRSILQGEYFKNHGLLNLVEYDYFGWLNEGTSLEELLPVAREMQADLRAYGFSLPPSEDLFGEMMAQLAKRSQRLLLGQECTPKWLSLMIVEHVVSKLPEGEAPQLIDMSCGSGAMIVEAVHLAKKRLDETRPADDRETKLQSLKRAITGFDIDPLPVLLSKVAWVLAAGDWLHPYGTYPITIPIYHADSLFAITPLSQQIEDEQGQAFYKLRIDRTDLRLPGFLISAEFQGTFDALLDFAYNVALASGQTKVQLEDSLLDEALSSALAASSSTIEKEQHDAAKRFLRELTTEVNRLNLSGRNGIWIFLLRNSYRPGLVVGQFNGLVSNPPWLALSKIADNPYSAVLKKKAELFGIKPEGPSFPHVELATIFLLHAVDRYLRDGAAVGCITPDSVLNGAHQNPFRKAGYLTASKAVSFALEEIWRVEKGTFKNEAIVLFGRKRKAKRNKPNPIPGALADRSGLTGTNFYRISLGKRTAWSEKNIGAIAIAKSGPANFRQGVDVMPRTLFFHETTAAPNVGGKAQWQVGPIDIASSPLAFAIRKATKYKSFRLTARVLPDDLLFDVLLSNLLTPFHIAPPLRALLPIRKNSTAIWEMLDSASIAVKGSAAVSAFREMAGAIGENATIEELWELINTRNKLVRQVIEPGGFLVFTGTSGALVCSAYSSMEFYNLNKLIIDQTLNWARVATEKQAIYLSGLFNSETINEKISSFQPEGAFGKRHIHSLARAITPPYNGDDPRHRDVVEQTRRLLAEYEQRKADDQQLRAMLDPNRGALERRRRVIKKVIKQLSSYNDYAEACRLIL